MFFAGHELDPSSSDYKRQCNSLEGCKFDQDEGCILRGGGNNVEQQHCSVLPSRNASDVCLLQGMWRVDDAELKRLDEVCDLTSSHLDEDIENAPNEFLRRSIPWQGAHALGPSDVITFDPAAQRCVAHGEHVNIRSSNGCAKTTAVFGVVLPCRDLVLVGQRSDLPRQARDKHTRKELQQRLLCLIAFDAGKRTRVPCSTAQMRSSYRCPKNACAF